MGGLGKTKLEKELVAIGYFIGVSVSFAIATLYLGPIGKKDREWDTFTIKAMKPKTMTLWSWRWGSRTLSYADFPYLKAGDLEAHLFKTKAEVAKDALNKHLEELKKRRMEERPLSNEIKYLQKMART